MSWSGQSKLKKPNQGRSNIRAFQLCPDPSFTLPKDVALVGPPINKGTSKGREWRGRFLDAIDSLSAIGSVSDRHTSLIWHLLTRLQNQRQRK